MMAAGNEAVANATALQEQVRPRTRAHLACPSRGWRGLHLARGAPRPLSDLPNLQVQQLQAELELARASAASRRAQAADPRHPRLESQP